MIARWLRIDPSKSSLLLGPRRSGKTTLLRNLFNNYKYVTLDDLDVLDRSAKDAKGLIESLGGFAVIDEIQRNPRLSVAVKFAIDNLGAIIHMTGSSSMGLLDQSSESLAGRINIESLPTLCWGEEEGAPDHSIFNDKVDSITLKQNSRTLEDAISTGGFPEVFLQKDQASKEAMLKNYRDTYFIRDMMQISNLENVEGMFAVFGHLARSIGSPLEITGISREAGISQATVKKYINALLQAQLVFRLQGWHFSPAKRFIKSAKYYFTDNGILQSFKTGVSDGQRFENFVMSELEKRRKLRLIKADAFYYFRTSSGREVDLVFDDGEAITAVEIKSVSSPSPRDITNLRTFVEDSSRKANGFLICGAEDYREEADIKIIPASAIKHGA